MTKKQLGLSLLCCLFVMLYAVVCSGGLRITSNDLEKELKKAKKKGYTVAISTNYKTNDVAEYSTMSIYSENREIGNIHFDQQGNERWHVVIEYYNGRRCKWDYYNTEDELTGYIRFEYDERGNMITERNYSGGMEEVSYHYKYDEQNRKISKEEEYGEGISPHWIYSSSYLYDEEGRLSREEIFINGVQLYSYIVYEYDGSVLLKEEQYRVGEDGDSYQQAIKYEYDAQGRLAKRVFYDYSHNCVGYMTYEYH